MFVKVLPNLHTYKILYTEAATNTLALNLSLFYWINTNRNTTVNENSPYEIDQMSKNEQKSNNFQVKVEKLAFEKCNSRRFQCIHNELSHSEGNISSMAIHLLLTRKQSSMCRAQLHIPGPPAHLYKVRVTKVRAALNNNTVKMFCIAFGFC